MWAVSNRCVINDYWTTFYVRVHRRYQLWVVCLKKKSMIKFQSHLVRRTQSDSLEHIHGFLSIFQYIQICSRAHHQFAHNIGLTQCVRHNHIFMSVDSGSERSRRTHTEQHFSFGVIFTFFEIVNFNNAALHYRTAETIHSQPLSASPLLFTFVTIHLAEIFIQRIYRYTDVVHTLFALKWGVMCVRNAIILLLLSRSAVCVYAFFQKFGNFFLQRD